MLQKRLSPFEFRVEDVFSISGHGTVVTGRVIKGAIRVRASVVLQRANGTKLHLAIKQIEGFRKLHSEALLGENVGLLFSDLRKDDVARGDLIVSTSDAG